MSFEGPEPRKSAPVAPRDNPVSARPLLGKISRALFHESADAILLADPATAVILDANPAAERATGRTGEELRGRSPDEFFVPNLPYGSVPVSDLFRIKSSLPPQSGYLLRTAHAGPQPVEMTITRLPQGPRGLLWVTLRYQMAEPACRSTDVTDPLSQAVLISMPGAVSALDREGRLIYVNPAFCELVGWSSAELLGQRPPFLLTQEEAEGITRKFRDILEGNSASRGPILRFQRRHGQSFDALVQPAALRDAAGEQVGWVATVTDVTSLMRIEAALRASEERFRSLCDCSPEGIFMTSPEGLFTFANARLQAISGLSAEEICGTTWPANVHPDDRDQLLDSWGEAVKAGWPHTATYRFLRRDGSERWFESKSAPVVAEHGRLLGHVGMVADVTEQRQAEEMRDRLAAERQELLERMQLLLEQMPIGCMVIDDQFRFTYINPAAERIFGYTLDEVRGLDPFGLILPAANQPPMREAFQRLAEGETSIVGLNENVTKDGRKLYCQWHNTALRDRSGRFLGVLGMCQDVTDRRRADEVLRESERRYRLLADNSTDMISRHDPAGHFLYVSPACTRLLQYGPGELLGRSLFELVYPDHRDEVVQAHTTLVREGSGPRTLTYLIQRKDGGHVWFEATSHVLRDLESGQLLEVHVASRDVTERRQAEERFRALVEKSSDGIVLLDETWRIRYVSPAGSQILRYATEELLGQHGRGLVHPEDLASALANPPALSERGAAARLRVRARRRDGSWRHLDAVVTNHLAEPNIAGYVVNFRDVTDLVELEGQLKQAQKMEAVGQLAGGIAHDFNNLLTAIIGNVVEVMKTTRADDPARELLHAADTSARRAAELTAQLLSFSRRQPLRLRPTHLGRAVEEALVILRPAIDPRVRIDVRCEPDLWLVPADPSQMTSVLVNLCLNARDAMPAGGELCIELANALIDEMYRRNCVYATLGERVRLRVEDNGCGMAADVVARVFEPFFTTKPQGAGTGLGLSMVYGTVKAHGGWITCQSSPGAGTRFEIYLPRAEQTVSPESTPPAPASMAADEPVDERNTILVVDDEPAIRALARRILEMQGYRVLLAEDGISALETYEHRNQPIHLIILDLTMPRLSGHDTYKRLREIDRGVRVLFSSGYSADQLDDAEIGAGFVSKPYRPDDLTRAVRQALAHGGVQVH
jgi:PAS domain S-box-containing protein